MPAKRTIFSPRHRTTISNDPGPDPEFRGTMKHHIEQTALRNRTRICRLAVILFCMLAATVLCCCQKTEEKQTVRKVSVPSDFNHPQYTIGCVRETTSYSEAKKAFPEAKFREFEDISQAFPALEIGEIDAIAFDRPGLDYAQRMRDTFVLMQDNYGEGHIAIAIAPGKNDLLRAVNAFLRDYFSSGLYDEMYTRWIKSKSPEMPILPLPASPSGRLIVGTESANAPMNFIDSQGEPSGFDVELIYRLAQALNVTVDVRVMPYHDLYAAVETGSVDLAVASMDVVKDSNLLFSEEYIDCPGAVLTRKKIYTPPKVKKEKSLQELAGTYSAVISGSLYANDCRELLPNTRFVLADSRDSACSLLISGKIDSILMEEPLARSCTAMYPEIQIASIVKRESYALAMPHGSPMYRGFNRVIEELKQSGELEELAAKWCSASPEKQEFATLYERDDVPKVNGVLRYATAPGTSPLCFMTPDGTLKGLEIELLRRAADEFGMEIQIIPARRDILMDMLRSGQVDVVGGMLPLSGFRSDDIDFSDSYYEGGAALVTCIPHDEYVFGLTKLSQLNGKQVGVMPFTFAAAELDAKLPQAIPFYANQERDLLFLLGAGKIDAFVASEPHVKEFLPLHPEFSMIPEFISRMDYAFVFPSTNKALSEAFSRQIRAMRKNGSLKQLQNKWISPMNVEAELPEMMQDAPNGVFRMGICVDRSPFCYIQNEKLAGYDLEIAQRAAASMGFLIEYVRLTKDEFTDAIANGKVDFGATALDSDIASSSKIIFADPHYNGGLVAVVPNKKSERKVEMGPIDQIKFFLREQMYSMVRSLWKDNHMRQILSGLKITLQITASAIIFGSLLGIPLCMLRKSKRKVCSLIGDVISGVFYNIPLLILLMGLYYVAFRRFGLSPLSAAMTIFILRFMAASCRLYMQAMDHIGGVQMDAAMALCLRPFTVFRRIILPQAAAYLAKPMREEVIRLVELTTIVGYIGVWDLTKMVDWIRGRTYESFFPIAFATLLYCLLSLALILVVSFMSKRFEIFVRKHALDASKSE